MASKRARCASNCGYAESNCRDAKARPSAHRARWEIEILFNVLKNACKVEALQGRRRTWRQGNLARLEGCSPCGKNVFTTAHANHALEAFEHAAFDYLLKPIRLDRLGRTVARLKEALREPAAAAPPDALHALLRQLAASAAPAPLQWIRAAHAQETRLIPVEDVIYFESRDKYTSVFHTGGESMIRTPLRQLRQLRQLREQLDPAQFWQIHRGVIVAARHIAGTHTDFRGRLMVKLKGRQEQLVVSRNYVELFRQM